MSALRSIWPRGQRSAPHEWQTWSRWTPFSWPSTYYLGGRSLCDGRQMPLRKRLREMECRVPRTMRRGGTPDHCLNTSQLGMAMALL